MVISTIIVIVGTFFLIWLNGNTLHKLITDFATVATIVGFFITLILMKSVKTLSDALHTLKDNEIFHEEIIKGLLEDLEELIKLMEDKNRYRKNSKCKEIHENIKSSYSDYFSDLEGIPGSNKITNQFKMYKSYLFSTKFHEKELLDEKVVSGIIGKTSSFKKQLQIYQKYTDSYQKQIFGRKAEENEQ